MNIRGNGVELTAVEADDRETIINILSRPAVLPYLFGCPSKAAETDFSKWLTSVIGNKNSYYYTVKDSAANKTAGICAYQDIDYRNGSVTVWTAVDPDEREKPYGAETLKALAKNAFDQMRMEHIVFYCFEGDVVSASAAKSAGFTRDAILYSRIRKGDKNMNLELYTLLKNEAVL